MYSNASRHVKLHFICCLKSLQRLTLTLNPNPNPNPVPDDGAKLAAGERATASWGGQPVGRPIAESCRTVSWELQLEMHTQV